MGQRVKLALGHSARDNQLARQAVKRVHWVTDIRVVEAEWGAVLRGTPYLETSDGVRYYGLQAILEYVEERERASRRR